MTSENETYNVTVNSPYDASCHGTSDENWAVNVSIQVYFGATVLFVLVGLVGNFLSMLVFSSRDMQTVSSNVYLLTLAASDSCYLISVFLSKTLTIFRCWWFPDGEFDIVNRSQWVCKGLQYASDVFSDYSTCLILTFTIERAIAVFLPTRFKQLCTVFRARITCVLLFLVVSNSIAPYHVISIGILTDYHLCTVLFEREDLFSILYVVEMLVFRLIPVCIIATLNAMIVIRVTRIARAKRRRRLEGLTTSSGGGGGNGTHALQPINQSSPPPPAAAAAAADAGGGGKSRKEKHKQQKAQQHQRGNHNQHHSEDRNLQLTIILILVSTSYVLAYIPVLIHFVIAKLNLSDTVHFKVETTKIVGNVSKGLYICGFAINFFLYTVSGRVFRDQLFKIVCRCRAKHAAANGAHVTRVNRPSIPHNEL